MINTSDLIDIYLVILLKSDKKEILNAYMDLFPQKMSHKDIQYYMADLYDIDHTSKHNIEINLEYLTNTLKANDKWDSKLEKNTPR